MSSDATQNLLQNQPLIAILINIFFFYVSCKPGQNFAIEKYDFSREISQNSAGFFSDLEQELRNENKSLLELFTTPAQQKYPLATDDKKKLSWLGWGKQKTVFLSNGALRTAVLQRN